MSFWSDFSFEWIFIAISCQFFYWISFWVRVAFQKFKFSLPSSNSFFRLVSKNPSTNLTWNLSKIQNTSIEIHSCESNPNTPVNGDEKRKRNSLQSNGDLKQRELSPSPRSQHRKSSHDIRLRANQSLLDPDSASGILRPLKTRNLINNQETFDTLHSRATDVSIWSINNLVVI